MVVSSLLFFYFLWQKFQCFFIYFLYLKALKIEDEINQLEYEPVLVLWLDYTSKCKCADLPPLPIFFKSLKWFSSPPILFWQFARSWFFCILELTSWSLRKKCKWLPHFKAVDFILQIRKEIKLTEYKFMNF